MYNRSLLPVDLTDRPILSQGAEDYLGTNASRVVQLSRTSVMIVR